MLFSRILFVRMYFFAKRQVVKSALLFLRSNLKNRDEDALRTIYEAKPGRRLSEKIKKYAKKNFETDYFLFKKNRSCQIRIRYLCCRWRIV